MINLRRLGILSLLLTAAYLFACDGGGSSSDGTGTLAVSLTDSSCSTYKAIYVTIDEVQANKNDASSNGNLGWETIATPMKTYNLYSLVNGVTEVLGQQDIEAGTYKQIRLIIGRLADSGLNINGDPHPDPNYVLFNDDTYESLKIPSGFNTGIKLVHNFVVAEGSYVELVLDFEACNSVVETGSGKYLLKPTIKIMETVDKTEVYGTVKDADTDTAITRATVSAQITDGQSVSIARSTITSYKEGEEGRYSLFLSPNQTYHVVVYSDEEIDDGGVPKLYTPTCQPVVEPKQVLQQDFALSKSSIGTISGIVRVSGDIDTGNPPTFKISFFSLLPLPCDAYVEVTNLIMSPGTDGSFSYLINLPYGTYDVVASSQGYTPATAPEVTLNSSLTSVSDLNFDF